MPAGRERSRFPSEALADAERRIAWLRLVAIPLVALSRQLPHPDPQETPFFVVVALFVAYALAALLWAHRRPVSARFGLALTAVDVAVISVLAGLSGGAYSPARLTYFLVPIAVAFRFRPRLTAAASAATVVAYLAQALAHPASGRVDAELFIAVQVGYLAWIGIAAILFSALLERRTERLQEHADARRQLLADALSAEERERRALAEGLHDHAIQNLLSARHELEEAAEAVAHPALARADDALAATVSDLREAIFELHPYVLEQAGLEAALRTVGLRAARRGGFRIRFDLDYRGHHPYEALVFATARELLTNAARHARASEVAVELRSASAALTLEVRDDGVGFDPAELRARAREGHIGLEAKRERVESAGGRLELETAPGAGTTVRLRLPA